MSESSEYYAEKMRRLREKQKASENKAKLAAPHAGLHSVSSEDAEADPQRDFSFEGRAPRRAAVNAGEKGKARPVSSEDKEAEKARQEASKRKRRRIALRLIIVAVTLVLGVFCVYKLLFIIKDVSVTGSAQYTAEQIIAASGITEGDNLYSFSSRDAAEKIRMYCPAIQSVSVKRTPPGRIALTVTDEPAVFWAELYGEKRLFTRELRVLAAAEEGSLEGLIHIKLPAVSRAVAGETAVFIDDGYYVFKAAAAAADSAIAERLGLIDVRHASEILMTCDGKYLLKLGEVNDVAIKLKIAESVLANEMFESGNKATLDLTDLSQTGVIIDNQLEIE